MLAFPRLLARIGAGLALGALLLGSAAPASARTHAALAAQSSSDTVSVQLPILPDSGGGNDIGLPISIAGGATVNMVFDTGSTGLRAFESAVGSTNLQKTDTQLSVEYGDGSVFTGVLAYAPMTVAGVTITTPGAFHLVQSVSCASSVPDCPGKNGASAYMPGMGGIAGVGLRMHEGSPALISVLNQLPGSLASGWTLSTGGFGSTSATLTLGLTSENRTGFSTTQLGAQSGVPATFPNGTKVWEDRGVNVCFTVGVNITGCWATTFDTGAETTNLSPPPGGPDNLQAGASLSANPGTNIVMSLQGVFDLTYAAGESTSQNAVNITPSTTPSANTGIQFFFRYTMLYDPVSGLLGFKPLS